MSDNHLARMASSIREGIEHHQALPHRQKNMARAGMGAMLVTGGIYTAWQCQAFTGWPAGRLLTVFFRAPAHTATGVWLPLAVWAGAMILGLLWLVVGVANSRGPRDTMSIFWAAVRLAVVGTLIVFSVYFPRDWGDWVPFGNVVLRGFYYMYFAASVLTVLLLLQSPARAPKQSDAHGRSRTATTEDLRRKGILR